ncbi:ABC transporter ATP-binding protein [Oceanobacillus jeddahense]|uniref:ABC transporter ATP-binding protein n=1 Tax=Oceanobacillus jeddahense TaxID=1462527 RepID=UPI0005962AAC|nr:ABC transporter ATP-binding protein [Oceanobacillus jeddahense]
MSFVTIENLYKKYNQVTALEDVNLQIKEGEFFALLGPSGCGKTTTMRCVAGFEDITSGNIFIDNQDVSKVPVNKRNCGMVFQSYALFPHMTVFENVSYSLQVERFNQGGFGRKMSVMARVLNRRLGKVPDSVTKKVMGMLKFVELEDFADRLTGQLSGGQQQRVALARSLVMEPSVLLMDEPLSNLDKKLRNTMRDTIREIQQKVGITTIFVTHDQEEAMSMADRVAVMSDGKVVQIDSPTNLYTYPKSEMVANFVGSSNIFDAELQEEEEQQIDGKSLVTLKISESEYLNTVHPVKQKNTKIMVRPESIELKNQEEGSKEKNVLTGKVLWSTYLGSMVTYDVQVGSLTLKVETIFKDHTTLLEEGSNIELMIDPERVIPIG